MPQIEISDNLYAQLQNKANEQNISIDTLVASILNGANPTTQRDFNADLLDTIADAMIIFDQDQRVYGMNQRAETLFGYSSAELIGQPITIFLPDYVHTIHQQLVNSFTAEDPQKRYMSESEPIQARTKDGTYFWATIALSSYRYDGQRFVNAIIHDVTELHNQISVYRTNEAQLRLLTDNATDIITLHDYDGTYLFVSNSVQRIMGYSAEELIGKRPHDVLHPDDMQDALSAFEESREADNPLSSSFRYLKKNGDIVWLESKSTVVFDETGQFENLVIISRDITQVRQTREIIKQERDKLQSFMDLSPSAVVVVNKIGNITLANKRAEDVLGITQNEIEARSYDAPDWKHTEYDGSPFPDEKQPFIRVMKTKEPVWDVRHAIVRPNGERTYLSINGMPIFDADGEISEIIFTIEDYTARKLQQDKLEAALENERAINRMRSDFLSLVSHELRTPLSIITTSTGLLRLKYGDVANDDIRNRLNRIETQVKRLNRLIADVTMINRADSHKQRLTLVDVNLEDFFENIITELSQVYDFSGDVKIIHPETKVVTQDRTLLEHIFMNLISNALKYNREGGMVEIQYFVTEEALNVVVSDEGIGIPEKDQRNLFELFHRASNVGKIAGTGLGLSIAKRAVDKLNGEIVFETAEGEGTQFIVTLPRMGNLAKKIAQEGRA